MFRGETIPIDSFVDFDDILSTGGVSSNIPSNANPRDALLCVTDLEDCCASPNVHGDWYFPDGNVVGSIGEFRVNRGVNEGMLIPSHANPSVNQTLYANICEFITRLVCVY